MLKQTKRESSLVGCRLSKEDRKGLRYEPDGIYPDHRDALEFLKKKLAEHRLVKLSKTACSDSKAVEYILEAVYLIQQKAGIFRFSRLVWDISLVRKFNGVLDKKRYRLRLYSGKTYSESVAYSDIVLDEVGLRLKLHQSPEQVGNDSSAIFYALYDLFDFSSHVDLPEVEGESKASDMENVI